MKSNYSTVVFTQKTRLKFSYWTKLEIKKLGEQYFKREMNVKCEIRMCSQ